MPFTDNTVYIALRKVFQSGGGSTYIILIAG